MAFEKSKKPPKDDVKSKKIGGMSRQQRAVGLEDEFRGRKPNSGYESQHDPEFMTQGDEANGAQLPASSPEVAYKGPEMGPFNCGACVHFVGEGQPCQRVSDPVSIDGICNLFESGGGAQPMVEDELAMPMASVNAPPTI